MRPTRTPATMPKLYTVLPSSSTISVPDMVALPYAGKVALPDMLALTGSARHCGYGEPGLFSAHLQQSRCKHTDTHGHMHGHKVMNLASQVPHRRKKPPTEGRAWN